MAITKLFTAVTKIDKIDTLINTSIDKIDTLIKTKIDTLFKTKIPKNIPWLAARPN